MQSSVTLRNRLKLRQLTLLSALGEVGSLHQAAERVGMTQPAATRLLQELEAVLDAPLFERSSRGVTPTDMGRLMIRHATAMLSGLDHVYEEAQAIRRGNAGSLRIGLFPGASPLLLARAVLQLKCATPHIDIQIHDGSQDALLQSLRGGQLNVVIGRMPGHDLGNDLHFEVLLRESFSLVTRPGHPLASAAPPLGLPELIDFPWVLPLDPTPLRGSLELQFITQCGRLPSQVIDCHSAGASAALLVESDYVALMPRSIAVQYVQQGLLAAVVDEVPGLHGPIMMLTLANAQPQQQLQRLAEALRTHFAQPAYAPAQ